MNSESKIAATLVQVLKNELPGNRLREGDVLEVTFLKKLAREAYFDMGKFGTGMVFGAEFINAREILRNLEPGTRLSAKVLDLDGENGYAELSVAEAGRQKVWQQVQELHEAGEIVKMKVSGANAGGLIGNLLDLRAFLPLSQLSNDHYSKVSEGDRQKTLDELKKFVGEEFSVKIINVNSRSNKLIVSERETMNANVKELLQQYQVGQVVDGIVSGLADFGIFVRFADNPQIEGLVHISEIDHRIIDSPKEVVKLSETISVKIIDIRENRVFLSMKALKEDPWQKANDHFKAGDAVNGKVYKYNPFGATVDLTHGLQGMIHVSEFESLDELKSKLPLGSAHEFIVESVKPEERRMNLKLKK